MFLCRVMSISTCLKLIGLCQILYKFVDLYRIWHRAINFKQVGMIFRKKISKLFLFFHFFFQNRQHFPNFFQILSKKSEIFRKKIGKSCRFWKKSEKIGGESEIFEQNEGENKGEDRSSAKDGSRCQNDARKIKK